MKSLVINAGSSSVKFQVFENEETVLSGLCEEIGNANSKIKLKENSGKGEIILKIENHKQAFQEIIKILQERNMISDLTQIVHRVVHGGEKFKKPTLINKEVIAEMKKLIPLAPLHNPANIEGIELMEELLPEVPQVAIFDTSFHSDLPEEAYLYGVPYSWYKENGVRKYGFHGSSHEYVMKEAIKLLDNPKAKIITCHLGNGASVCATKNGKSVDTSMGMTPLEGNVMGTRSGSIDPGIIFHVMKEKNISCEEMEKILNKESGLKGLSEITSDMRPLEENMMTCEKSARAMKVYLYSLLKIIGSYVAVLNGVDAIIFTGGAGEKSAVIRKYIADNLEFLGLKLDEAKNKKNELDVSKKSSKVKVFVIPTNEELQMVRNAKNFLKDK
jgi:acetate kinase